MTGFFSTTACVAACVAAFSCAVAPQAALADAPHDITASQRLWLDGLDVSGTDTGNGGGTNPANGAQVTSWKDKSVNGFIAGNATDFAATNRTYPTYTTGTGVTFDGVKNVLEVPSGLYGNGTIVNDSDIFTVYDTKITKASYLFYQGSAGDIYKRISYSPDYAVAGSPIYWDHGSPFTPGRATVSFNGIHSQLYLYNLGASVNGTQSIVRDGTTLVSVTSSASHTQLSTNRFYIGCGELGGGSYHNGVVAELIVYSRRLNSAEKNIIQSYLAAKHANPGGAGTANRYTNTDGFRYHIGGIGQESDGSLTTGTSAGLTIANSSFLANGNYVLAGLPALSPATGSNASDVPSGYQARSQRVWYLNRTGTGTGAITLTFKLSDLGVTASSGQKLALLSRSGTSGTFATLATTTYGGAGTIAFTLSNPQNGYYALALSPAPVPTASVATTVQSDGSNTANFKAIPNALIKANAIVTNTGPGTADANSTVFSVAIPANTKFYLGDIGTVGGGPVNFTQGTTTSGLTYTYTSLTSTTDSLDFSSDAGASWTYTPTVDAQQGDAAITNIRVKLTGTFATGTSPNFPAFTITYGLLVK
ncbi:MAG: hypothetical protein RIQ99_884 [Pseudomonadota bacterium]|jgi:hypothetical protein